MILRDFPPLNSYQYGLCYYQHLEPCATDIAPTTMNVTPFLLIKGKGEPAIRYFLKHNKYGFYPVSVTTFLPAL